MLRCPWRRGEETSETSKNKNKYKYLHQQQKQPTTVYVICSLCPNQSFRVKNIVIVFNKTTLIFFFFWGKTLSSHVPVILHPYLHYSVACFLVTVHIQKHHSGLFAFLGLKRTNQKMDNYILLAWQLLLVLISFIMCVSVCVCIY